jgi:hypothetical protein
MSKVFKVYFELYGKKMVKNCQANTEDEAKAQIMAAIKFHKIEISDTDPKETQAYEFLIDAFLRGLGDKK